MPRIPFYFIAKAVFWCFVLVFVGPFLRGVCVQVNLHLDPQIPWFVAPAAVIAVATFIWSERFAQLPASTASLTAIKRTIVGVLLALGLCIAGLSLMDHASVLQGRALLPGDPDPAPGLFRAMHSLTLLASAGLIEEGAVRNIVQLRLQREMTPLAAEVIAGVVFILLHWDRWDTPAEFPFVALVALVCGRLAAVTQSARIAALTHSVANLGIGATILYFRR